MRKSRHSAGELNLIAVSKTGPEPQLQQAQIQQPQTIPIPQSAGDPLSFAIMTMNTNPYFIGMFMLLLNLGGRFLSLELTKKQEAFLQAQWVRPLIFFTVIFMATRNVVAAFWLTVMFFFVIWIVANENSPYCMIPSWCGHNIDEQTKVYQKNIEKLQK
jgi:hypothetical protein